MNNKQQIEVAKELAECEGMENSPYGLFITQEYGVQILPLYYQKESKRYWGADWERIYYGTRKPLYIDDTASGFVGPYLENDSSAAFLTRSGWDATTETLLTWLNKLYLSNQTFSGAKNKSGNIFKTALDQIYRSLKEGSHELAYNIAIVLLYKVDRTAYDKGIAPLLEEG